MRALLPVLTAAAILAAAVGVQAEVSQRGTLRVSFAGKLSPHELPRTGTAPVAVSLSGEIRTSDNSVPPQLRKIKLAINRHGRLDYKGLPACRYHQIQPASTDEAREACRSSLVGTGDFKANVALPEQSPFPSNGDVLAFNGTLHGRPVIYAHIYGTKPVPISQVVPFAIARVKGTYRTALTAELPQVAAEWGYVSGISLNLSRIFHYKGRLHSYLSAGCPAPKGFPGATFPFAHASFGFDNGQTLSSTLTRSCGVRSSRRS